ncbi:MAG TPA: aldose 1-epimerase family protein [Gammaproteobacteria bacterium]|nr:aldose 1-epimerase family protein [Gammaproteobacteria bacterium]
MIYELSNSQLKIKTSSLGAELQSLFSVAMQQELLWQADPKYWARHAPVLFPIVGKLANDKLKVGDQLFPMGQHGLARDSEFIVISQLKNSITFQLTSSPQTLKHFPFDFQLIVEYTLLDDTLLTTYTVVNPATTVLRFSLGAHPAFNWPLIKGIDKKQYKIIFNKEENGLISQLENGLIKHNDITSPVNNKILMLDDGLFEHDALIFKNIKSKSIRYESAQNDDVNAAIELHFEDFNDLGIWTKPGAGFICLEPWLGYSSDVGFDGDFFNKPGIIQLPGQSSRSFSFETIVSMH